MVAYFEIILIFFTRLHLRSSSQKKCYATSVKFVFWKLRTELDEIIETTMKIISTKITSIPIHSNF